MAWHPCNCCTYCPWTLNNDAPGQFQVDIEGLAPASPVVCGDCGDLNASYILDKSGAWVSGAFGGCPYDYAVDPPICNVARVVLQVGHYTSPPLPATSILIVYLVDADNYILAAAKKIYDGWEPDVMHLAGEDLGALTFYAVTLGCSVAASNVKVSTIRRCYQRAAETFDADAFDGETFE